MKNIYLFTIIVANLIFVACATVNIGSDKHDMAGNSAVSVDNKNVENYENLAAYMRGRVAGVRISQDGETITIRRNTSAIKPTVDPPLIIVDGIEMSFSQANKVILPSDIQSVTVDREGTLYGFRGASGVIIITTKRGGE